MDGGSGIICYNWLVSAATRTELHCGGVTRPPTPLSTRTTASSGADFNHSGTIQE